MSWLSEQWKQSATPEEFYDMLADMGPLTFLERAKLFMKYAPPGTSLFLGTLVQKVQTDDLPARWEFVQKQ